MQPIQKQLDKKDKKLPKQMSENVNNKKIPHAESKKKSKIRRQNYIARSKKKSPHRQSLRLRNQPRKDYKTFIPQSKVFKKVDFQKPP